jgi:hypothetical protein
MGSHAGRIPAATREAPRRDAIARVSDPGDGSLERRLEVLDVLLVEL